MSAPLISAPELTAALVGQRPPVLLDVRWTLGGPPGKESYAAGHLPGAVYLDLPGVLAGEPGREGRHPLPDPGKLEVALRAAGVDQDAEVVVYDGGEMPAAARAWWVLRWAGHRAVRVLDGGLAAWQRDGGVTTTDVPGPRRGSVRVQTGAMPVLDAEGAAAVAVRGVLLDARSPERFRGSEEPIDPVAGRIPGSVNAPSTYDLCPDGTLLSPDGLRERYGSLGVWPGREVGAYCGSGVTAAQTVLALARIGVDAALYVGSWSEWITEPSRPVATG